jgi:hypothetical protein
VKETSSVARLSTDTYADEKYYAECRAVETQTHLCEGKISKIVKCQSRVGNIIRRANEVQIPTPTKSITRNVELLKHKRIYVRARFVK